MLHLFEKLIKFPFIYVLFTSATYHTAKTDDCPNGNWKVQDLKDWLKKENISYDEINDKKDDLWQKAKSYLMENPRYKVEGIAAKYGHIILRLPPYHPELNPIGRLTIYFLVITLFHTYSKV